MLIKGWISAEDVCNEDEPDLVWDEMEIEILSEAGEDLFYISSHSSALTFLKHVIRLDTNLSAKGKALVRRAIEILDTGTDIPEVKDYTTKNSDEAKALAAAFTHREYPTILSDYTDTWIEED